MYINKTDAIRLVSEVKQEFILKQRSHMAIDAIDKIIERMHNEDINEWSVLVIFKHLLNISMEYNSNICPKCYIEKFPKL